MREALRTLSLAMRNRSCAASTWKYVVATLTMVASVTTSRSKRAAFAASSAERSAARFLPQKSSW